MRHVRDAFRQSEPKFRPFFLQVNVKDLIVERSRDVSGSSGIAQIRHAGMMCTIQDMSQTKIVRRIDGLTCSRESKSYGHAKVFALSCICVFKWQIQEGVPNGCRNLGRTQNMKLQVIWSLFTSVKIEPHMGDVSIENVDQDCGACKTCSFLRLGGYQHLSISIIKEITN